MTLCTAAPVFGGYLAGRWFSGRWGAWVVPLSAVFVVLSGPVGSTATKVQSAPAGLLAVIGSFLRFGLGTLAALTRHRWNHDPRQ